MALAGRGQPGIYRGCRLAGIVAVLHPALGFATRDIAAQVGIELPDDRELAARQARVSSFVDASAMVSLVVTAVALVVNLGL